VLAVAATPFGREAGRQFESMQSVAETLAREKKRDLRISLLLRGRYSDWLPAGRPRGRISSPGKGKMFFRVVQTGSGTHPASYPVGTGGKAAGA
jgi:hypothetical protein